MKNDFKISKYIVCVDDLDEKNILFNCATGSLMLLDKDKYSLLENNLIDKIDSSLIELLKKSKIIIPSECNEEVEYLKHIEKSTKNDEIYLTISPTFLCNFDCSYCFVNKSNSMINTTTLNSIINCIKSNNFNRDKMINIIWFGGETLLALDHIIEFTQKLERSISSNNIRASIVTNGYLLNQDVLVKLIRSHIKIIQITFDGNEYLHNKYRKTKCGKETYKQIMENIINLLSTNYDFVLNLRCNYFSDGADSDMIAEFVKDIAPIIQDDKRVNIQLKPIIDFSCSSNTKSFFDSYDNVELIKQAITKELPNQVIYNTVGLPKPKIKWCSSGEENMFNIGPSGELYFCKSQFGYKDKAIGYINEDGSISYNKNYDINVRNNYLLEKCLECKYLPLCMGGCKRLRVDKNKAICYWNEESIKNLIRRNLATWN
ncbi:radical SAM protein [Tissierella sp. MB52-C2]|uniref:radical SAM/SPASM domain-containing protein n=1 Tax=Tissierella sp. MB52-C2 TaxID=3070999 RepID=UPI00280BC5AB|nr:radical SAM protein [Tissierella sp. MB52-C2]WMM25676.1 radical SAM protein [Tissierella sp. MB52-C2]